MLGSELEQGLEAGGTTQGRLSLRPCSSSEKFRVGPIRRRQHRARTSPGGNTANTLIRRPRE